MSDAVAADAADTTKTDAAALSGAVSDSAVDDAAKAAAAVDAGADKTAQDEAGKGAETLLTTTEEDDAANKGKAPASFPDNWRELLADGDKDIASAIARYGSPKGVAKALKDAQARIRSGDLRKPLPDNATDEQKAEWRKENGIPSRVDDYVLSQTLPQEDRDLAKAFLNHAHARNMTQEQVDGALQWFEETKQSGLEAQAQADKSTRAETEDALRAEWGGEYRSNVTLAARTLESLPGDLGKHLPFARLPDGRKLGDTAEFVQWAAQLGRETYGDAAFISGDGSSKLTGRKSDIEHIMKTDIQKYYKDGLDKEYASILESEMRITRGRPA